MPASFDPYCEWLSIPPEDQPANFYRLLGVKLHEDNAAVINSAADRQMAHVRTFATGPRGAISQRVLNELSMARVMLCDPARKAAYDAMLRSAASESQQSRVELAKPQPKGAEAALDKGKSFGGYRVLEVISRTDTGTLYKAVRQSDGLVVSLKVIPRELSQNADFMKRLRREFDLTRTLQHPNVVAGYELGEVAGRPYLAFEYVGGADLGRVVADHGPLDVTTAVEVTRRVADGLAYLHRKGVVHRNIKPQNLLVNVQGVVKIANLTTAREEETRSFLAGREVNITIEGTKLGTPDYQAPEQAFDAHHVDGRADIYSLGCTLFHLLIGRPPFSGKNAVQTMMAHKNAPIPSLQVARPETPQWLDSLYIRMMAKKPEERISAADEVSAALARGDAPVEVVAGINLPIVIASTVAALVAIFLIVLVVLSQRT